jgi:meiotically up-regulated gene 157 (Mug157) protein
MKPVRSAKIPRKFAHYHFLLGQDPELASLVKAVINNEARYVAQYPYCISPSLA